jgi:hypothetical protein
MMTPDPVRNRSSNDPTVSVIVPARNEQASLGACLDSLSMQAGVDFEIIVVDDGSTDDTREIAESFSKIRVITPGPLPSGWTGKNNAVFAGSQRAHGEWLLFTDADTAHVAGSMARALVEVKQRGASLLSYSPEQEVHGFLEKAIMPVIFAELAANFRPSEVSDPASPSAAANGQYILISREAYDAVGGHASIATCLLEDVELARAVKSSGRKIFFRYGGDAVSTRMYRSFAQLREGWTKNLVLLFRSPALLAARRVTEFILVVASATLAITAALFRHPGLSFFVATLCLMLIAFLLLRVRRAHFSWDAHLLSILGLPLFSYLLLRSRLWHSRKTVSWKGRIYTPGGQLSGKDSAAVRVETSKQHQVSVTQH